MDQQLAQGPIGSVGSYDVKFQGSFLVAGMEAQASDSLVSGKLEIKLDGNKVIDALKTLIPGQIDDAIFEILRAALLKS